MTCRLLLRMGRDHRAGSALKPQHAARCMNRLPCAPLSAHDCPQGTPLSQCTPAPKASHQYPEYDPLHIRHITCCGNRAVSSSNIVHLPTHRRCRTSAHAAGRPTGARQGWAKTIVTFLAVPISTQLTRPTCVLAAMPCVRVTWYGTLSSTRHQSRLLMLKCASCQLFHDHMACMPC